MILGHLNRLPDPYLLRVLRPRLAAELGEDAAAKFFTANPARALSWA